MKAQTPMQVWKVPLVLGALSLVGLFVALVADGAGDVASWVALAAPTGAGFFFALRGRESE